MKPKSRLSVNNALNLFVTEVNSNSSNRSQTTKHKQSNLQSTYSRQSSLNERSLKQAKLTGHLDSKQIKKGKMQLLNYMINEGTQFANLENIEEYYTANAYENNKNYDLHSSEIQKKKDEIDKLDLLIKQVRQFIIITKIGNTFKYTNRYKLHKRILQ